MASNEPKKFIGYGELNPISKPNIFNSNESIDLMSIIRENAYNSIYKINALDNTGPYRAICLRVLTGVPAESRKSIWKAPDSNIGKTTISVRARIPEIHAYIPDPYLENDLAQKNLLIDMHPLFVGDASNSSDVPGETDLIMVDFVDKQNFREGLFLARLEKGLGQNLGVPIIASAQDTKELFTAGNRLIGLDSSITSEVPLMVQSPLGDVAGRIKQPVNTLGKFSSQGKKTKIQNISDLGGSPHFPVKDLKCKGQKIVGKTVGKAVEKGLVSEAQIFYLRQTAQFLETSRNFWRAVFSDAEIIVSSVLRLPGPGEDPNSMHRLGLATDISVRTKFAQRWPGTLHNVLPVHIVYCGYRYMLEKGILPLGALGLYINVQNWDEKKPFTTRASAGNGKGVDTVGLAGSANVHYDWRGSKKYGSEKLPKKNPKERKETAKWVYLDTDGDGVDEIKAYSSGQAKDAGIHKIFPSIYKFVWQDEWKIYARTFGLQI